MTLQEKVRLMRKTAGITQFEVAELARVSTTSVGNWENGIKIPELDNLIKLADIFGVSLDVFRQDAKSLEMPHPYGKKLCECIKEDVPEENEDDESYYKGVPLRFGSVKPVAEKAAMLDFCEAYLSSLPSQYFIKGTGQNSKYGTGRYFWESKIDMLMFIGITPPLRETHPGFAFSVALAVDEPLDEETISEFGCLQLTDEDDTWIYAPIKCDAPFAFGDELSPQQKKAADTALKAIMQVARKVLDKSLSEIFHEA